MAPKKGSAKRSRKGSRACPRGKILKKSHSKKSHIRRSYKKKDGTRVKASYVSRTQVPATCVPDKGAPGKTPPSRQVLPKFQKEISLRRHGYSVHKSATDRHKALDKATRKHDPLKILRHLNLARNYQADKDAKEVMEKDVRYMSRQYTQYKKKHGIGSKARKGSRKTSAKRLRKGSRRGSRKVSKKTSRKRSRRVSKKRSKKASKRGAKKRSKRR